MSDLSLVQLGLIALVFVWSGFVRSGLGFGGAALSLPFLLLIADRPVVFLPIIGIHLLVFSSLTVWQSHRQSRASDQTDGGTVDWHYLGKLLALLLIPKLIGVFGLLTLPDAVMSGIIFVIVGSYSISYILNKPFQSNSKALEIVFIILGGYISGASLVGAPLLIAVAAQHVARHQLRDTLFALWFVLVCIKLGAFVAFDVDLQLLAALYLLPAAALGHVLGLRFHSLLQRADSRQFYRGLGWVLLITSSVGVVQVLL
ncbi:permease [Saccharospirillum sp. MSK14-1]|uniref:TSUP family transporter n=1 Tax=Saccharospirillum sp. MSK14-1 TaxID=1897632 RepID=UPI000D3D4BBA|nr:TSUP family transporter [Saccharospirillum sp. MSK14-1]PTY37798.1 permease [Saccharospirillum sp. MSK14-1]